MQLRSAPPRTALVPTLFLALISSLIATPAAASWQPDVATAPGTVATDPAPPDAVSPGTAKADEPVADNTSEDAATAPEEPAAFAGSVTVTAPLSDYAAREAATATKSSAPLLVTPQAVTVVTGDFLEDLPTRGLQDALHYASGVRSEAYGVDSRTDSFFVRGAVPDKYLDGMRQHFNYYTSTTRTDPYLLERIEVLRGPSSMLYGQGSPAGVLNLVSKKPRPAVEREVRVRGGSFGLSQAQADLTGPLTADGTWSYRLVALGREADTQVDFVEDDRALLAPSLRWAPSAATSWTFQLRWQQDRSGSTLQFLPWSGTVAPNPNGPIPTETFIGDPRQDRYDSELLTAGWLLRHDLSDRWTVRQNLRWSRNEVDYRSLYADPFSNPADPFLDAGERVIGRYAFADRTEVDMLTTDQGLEGSFTTGGVRHRLLVGVDALRFREGGRSAFDLPRHLGGGVPAIDVYDPVHAAYTFPETREDPEATQQQVGVYLQDHVELGERWIVLAGLRHDRTEDEVEGQRSEETDATTGRLGLMYAARGGWSPYVSYTESFTPVPGTDFFNQRFDPLRGEQLEVGVKVQPPGGGYAFTAAVFELREENRLVSDPANPQNRLQAGETESEGLEVEYLGRVAGGVDLRAHYNYLDQDGKLEALPDHQAGLWGMGELSLGPLGSVSLGLGVRYLSEFRNPGAPAVPETTLFDATAEWVTGSWRLALQAANLADEVYVSTCLARGDCFYGARRTVSLSAGYRF